ncbi:MAG: hypothetical protein BWY22_02468 [Bacteroidetes bacterium ADurb.Bin217]|nr:MAG: hypothetical protein BWY22_02468 [Bacteroidetes bacterium ADurb.Bin217]
MAPISILPSGMFIFSAFNTLPISSTVILYASSFWGFTSIAISRLGVPSNPIEPIPSIRLSGFISFSSKILSNAG